MPRIYRQEVKTLSVLQRKFWVILLALGASVLALAGCGGGGGSSQSLVRSLSAYVPTAGTTASLSIVTSGNIFLTGGTGLAFGQFGNGGGYVNLPAGTLSAGASGTGTSTPITFLTTPTLAGNNTPYTLVIAGESGQTGTLAPQLILIPSYTTSQFSIPSGDAAIRVVNLSLNPNPVSLYTTTNGTPTAALNTGVGSVSYGYNSTTNGYITVPTTQLTNLALVDSTLPQNALSLSTSSNLNTVSFAQGQAYTLYILGQPGNSAEPLTALWTLDYPVL